MGGGYVALNDTTYASGRHSKVSAVLGKDYEPILVQHPANGKIIEVATEQAVAKASGPDVDEQLTDRLAELIYKNAPKTFGKRWLLDLAKEVYERLSLRDETAVAKAWGWPENAFDRGRLPAQAAKLAESDLVLLMFHLVFAVGPYTRDGVLKLFGIKEQATREKVIEECKAAAAKARAEAKAKKEAKAKASPAKKPAGKKAKKK
jgi:hypothetical protein